VNILNKEHIDWIDGAKGVAVFAVILLHSLPCLHEVGWMLHIGQAVPVFIFITAYLASTHYKSFCPYFAYARIESMLRRVLLPFLVVLLIQIIACQISDSWWSWKSIIKDGGIGPGSYYVWLFIQIWFLLPFVIELVRRTPIWLSFAIMLVFSIVTEYVFAKLHCEQVEQLYRLLPIRYLMVVYAGCVYKKLTTKQETYFFLLAVISGIAMIMDVYCTDFQNVMITPPYWDGVHWFTALYVLVPISILQKFHYSEIWRMAGKYSWQIFLLQMMCFGF